MKSSNETRKKLIDVTYEEVYEKRVSRSIILSEILSKAQVHKRLNVLFFLK